MAAASSLFKVRNVFEIQGGQSVTANLSIKAPAAEVFDALLGGYREWCKAKKSPFSHLQVFINAPVKAPEHEVLLRYLVERWNSTEKPRCPGRVDVWVGSNEQSWYGFTNGIYPDNPSNRTQTVRYITYEEMDAALTASVREGEERERAARRANPVRTPVRLPKNIASEIARYLRLEYAELEVGRLKAKDLAFVGEVTIDCVPTQFWAVSAALQEPMWAVAERFEDGYALSSTSELPDELGGRREG
jgi:hypothetical protein